MSLHHPEDVSGSGEERRGEEGGKVQVGAENCGGSDGFLLKRAPAPGF